MHTIALALTFLLASALAHAQPANAPDLDYAAVPESFSLPAGYNFGAVSGIAVNAKGNVFVLNRGPHPIISRNRSTGMLATGLDIVNRAEHYAQRDS